MSKIHSPVQTHFLSVQAVADTLFDSVELIPDLTNPKDLYSLTQPLIAVAA